MKRTPYPVLSKENRRCGAFTDDGSGNPIAIMYAVSASPVPIGARGLSTNGHATPPRVDIGAN
jgi:hypothetical protein